MYICIYARMYICVYVCVKYVCVYVCMYVCVCVCICFSSVVCMNNKSKSALITKAFTIFWPVQKRRVEVNNKQGSSVRYLPKIL